MRALPRRCQSLPCNPELSQTGALLRHMEAREKENDEDTTVVVTRGEMGEGDVRKETGKVEKRLQGKLIEETEKKDLLKEENGVGDDSGLLVELEMVSLEQLEEEEESIFLTEPMDCTKSPEAAEGRHMFTSTSSSILQTNGWRLPIFIGPPSLPPLPRLNNNGSAPTTGKQWGRGELTNGYSGVQVLSSDPGGLSEQDEVISCPDCCLVGLSLPSMCLRGSAAIPAQFRRASLPRERPYQNLNGPISGSNASSSRTATKSTKSVLCTNSLVVAEPSVSCELGLSLPEA